MRTGAVLILLALSLLTTAAADPVAAEAVPGWHGDEQPLVAGVGVPIPLGAVGDIEFWAPNRGLLITGGNEGAPSGLYSYDGTGWHLYSTVCGGSQGRIAWAGPNEFWTVSDKRLGQEKGSSGPLSLCHFKNGQVVGSYATPDGEATSYQAISAAACAGPSDCWFAGERLPATAANVGAFHLHWNGATLTAVPSLSEPQPELGDPGRAVRSLASFQGQWFEAVKVQAGDSEAASEPDPEHPSLLHRIEPAVSTPFVPLFTPGLSYGTGAVPSELDAFRLGEDGTTRLWGVAGSSGAKATVTMVRYEAGGFVQVPLLEPTAPKTFETADQVTGLALEPGTDDAWVSFRHKNDAAGSIQTVARVTKVHADGTVDQPIVLPGSGEGIGRKGAAGPLACAASGQCWMATAKGWLFHLGGSLPRDEDPLWHQPVIEYRPPDESQPGQVLTEQPVDDSGAEPPAETPSEEILVEKLPRGRKAKALVAKVHQRLVDRSVLELSFVLHARAHVRLRALWHKRVVAETPRLTLGKGQHLLRLRLDPDRWPTHLDFQVHAAGRGKG